MMANDIHDAWKKTICSLCILATKQAEEPGKTAKGVCITGTDKDQLLSLDFMRTEEDPTWQNTIVSAGIQDSHSCLVHYVSPELQLETLSKTARAVPGKWDKTVTVKLYGKLCPKEEDIHPLPPTLDEYKGVFLESGSSVSEQPFFPLAVDDYFMSVAILSKGLSSEEPKVGACIVSNDSPHIFGIGYNDLNHCSEMRALVNAQRSHVDLTKCTLYTTGCPCRKCIEVILKVGIRVVVHGGDIPGTETGTETECVQLEMAYSHKACFKKYKCYIRTKDKQEKEKKFLIDLSTCKAIAKRFIYSELKCTKQLQVRAPLVKPSFSEMLMTQSQRMKPSYTDFFMAIAFLSPARSKDNKHQVGACLVTPAPHRLVAMGYNGMPDGRGFRDVHMDWGSLQPHYICHAELNAVIAAFRREADLSACTLYVTHSPCADCSKLIAQSGIKNVVFAKYYKNGKAAYNLLQRLPDVKIMRYEYMSSQHHNIARMTINLSKLSVNLSSSWAKPETEWKPEEQRQRSNSCDLPADLQLESKHVQSKSLPNLHSPQEIEKGKRKVYYLLDDYFMMLAVLAKSRSPFKDEKARVGACLVYHEPQRAISVGYNGYPDGFNDRHDEDYKCCAELNAVVSAFRYHANLTNSTLYTTGFPCHKCATTIVQSGIKTIVHGDHKSNIEKRVKKAEEDRDQAVNSRKKDEAAWELKKARDEKESVTVAEEIFYWGKVATLEYKVKTEKPIFEIDLHGLTTK